MAILVSKLARTALTPLAILLGADAASAAPVAVDFTPPNIKPGKICVARSSDEEIVERWTNWNGSATPEGLSMEAAARELVRLRDIDPEAHFDLVRNGLDQLKANYPDYKQVRYLIDLINLHIKAGQIQKLKDLALIGELKNSGYETSSKALNFMADLHLNGLISGGSDEDILNLKLRAAYGGNADALLYLAQRVADGEIIEGWDVVPEIAVSLAFGSILGKLNPTICDRIGQIARAYYHGEVVQQDYKLSEQWYRFAADLGDDNAAWKTAEYHLTGEFIIKDNDVLLRYLEQASEAGQVQAQLEYGRILENGALTDQNLDEALEIYEQLAKAKPRAGLLRKLSLLERFDRTTGGFAETYEKTIAQLAQLDDAPAWIHTKQGQKILKQKGRWDGLAEARKQFQIAAEKGDASGRVQLAKLILRNPQKPEDQTKALDLLNEAISLDMLNEAISNEGDIAALIELSRYQRCFAPIERGWESASYWRTAEIAAGNKSLDLSMHDIQALANEPDPDKLATLQTTALFGRSGAIADFGAYLMQTLSKQGNAPSLKDNPVLAFWAKRASQSKDGTAKFEKALYLSGLSEVDRQKFKESLSQRVADGDPYASRQMASIQLSQVLAAHKSGGHDPKSIEVLLRKARELLLVGEAPIEGNEIIRLADLFLETMKTELEMGKEEVEQIVEHGNAEALMWLSSQTDNAADRAQYLQMAESLTQCNFDAAFKFVDHLKDPEFADKKRRWLAVAEGLSSKSWQLVKLADLYAKDQTPKNQAKAYALYTEALNRGNSLAALRLLDMNADPTSERYDQVAAIDAFDKALTASDPDLVYAVLMRLKRAPEPVRTAIHDQHDLEGHYRLAAKSNRPNAMRELAILLRSGETTASRVSEAVTWLEKSAQAGDVNAMAMLAETYAFGIGVEPSPDKAQHWLAKASEAGDEKAQSLLAVFYNKEDGQ